MSNTDFDVVISGGGPVGAALACLLSQDGWRVLVVERGAESLYREDVVDARTLAISPASQQLLDRIGAWSGVMARRYSPYRAMRVWDATGAGELAFDAIDVGAQALGYIVENQVVQRAVYEATLEQRQVAWQLMNSISGVEHQADAVAVHLQGGETYRCRLLVAADGAQSSTRTLLGVDVLNLDYAQQALVAVVATAQSHESTAWQRFLPTGPLAFLPLADGRCAIVWTLPNAEAERLMELDNSAFATVLHDSFAGRLGAITEIGPRASVPLRRMHATRYVGDRFALVGDAAHVIHPLAGQGVNLGLADVACLARVLREARHRKHDLGDVRVLRRYERARRAENAIMLHSMDAIKRTFASPLRLSVMARNLGMQAVNSMPMIKRLLMAQAMGSRTSVFE